MKVFFLVPARSAKGLDGKITELEGLGFPYVVVCGEKVDHPNVVFREPRGKFDAINEGLKYVPSETEVVALNDADTRIHGLTDAFGLVERQGYDLVYARVNVTGGPQLAFYSYLDSLRRRIPIAASGELMLIRRGVLDKIIPLKGCKAEDSLILFKVLENGGKIAFSEKCFVTTTRTSLGVEEESYKRRTVGGIYQALSLSKPPFVVRLFYVVLPFVSPLLMISGKKGYHWAKGILMGFVDYLRGDKAASWRPTYKV
jgi:hypothetical protein